MAKRIRQQTVLFFLAGAIASEEEQEAIAEFDGDEFRVMFRNASFVNEGDAIEKFDIVAGAVPDNYARAAEAKERDGEPVNEAEAEAAKAAKAEEARKAAAEAKAAKKAAAEAAKAKPPAQGGPKPAQGANPPAPRAWTPNA